MRRTLLLFAATAAALVVVSGLALAADVSCPNRSGTNLCVGTDAADVLTGSDQADDMRARGGDDMVSGLGGADRILAGEGDDTFDGGTSRDSYVFSGDWGTDTIAADASGRDAVRFWHVAPGGSMSPSTARGIPPSRGGPPTA